MKKIYSNIIPPAGFKAITIWPLLLIRKKTVDNGLFNDTDERHEMIHGAQQREMLVVIFYLWYAIEWFVRLIIYLNGNKAYKNISFEREAFENQCKKKYLKKRASFAWFKYL